MLPTEFQINWPFGSGEEANSHLGFLIRTIVASFDLHVIPMVPYKFQVSWPFFSSGEEGKYIFKTATTVAILDC